MNRMIAAREACGRPQVHAVAVLRGWSDPRPTLHQYTVCMGRRIALMLTSRSWHLPLHVLDSHCQLSACTNTVQHGL